MRIRRVSEADVPFLERMMLLAGFPPDRPLPEGAQSLPHVRRFLDGWGRAGDVGVIAVEDRPVGAAWARRLDEPLLRDEAGTAVAEVAIAVEEGFRGRGTGTALLDALSHAAAADGHSALALTVSARNPALRLYRRAGFEIVEEGERGLVLRRRLA